MNAAAALTLDDAPPETALSDAALAAGARIACHGGRQTLRERVRLSSGTRPVGEDPDLARLYADYSIVPRAPWRTPSDSELRALTAEGVADPPGWRIGCDAAVVRIPDCLTQPMMDMLDRHEVRDRGDQAVFHGKLANDPLWLAAVAALRRYLTPFSRDKMGGLPLSMGPGNHDTLTKDRHAADSQKFIGLHLDSWDKHPLRLRHRSRNRLCINLGREARYSLFVNLPLMQMFGHLGLRDPEDIYADFRGLALGHRFMMARPEYPAVRLRIEPGEAYILPTDNLIHDGSTTGTAHPDITMTFIGRFAPTPVAPGPVEAS